MTTRKESIMADDQAAAPETNNEQPIEAEEVAPPAEATEETPPPAAEESTENDVAEQPATTSDEAPVVEDTADVAPAEKDGQETEGEAAPAAEDAVAAEEPNAEAGGEPPADGAEAPAEDGEGEQDKPTEGEPAAEGEKVDDEESKEPEKTEGEGEKPEEGDVEKEAGEKAEGAEGATEGEEKPDVVDGEEKPEADQEGGQAVETILEDEEGEVKEEQKEGSPVPQSDTFAEGERPETPTVAVMEPLSREGTPRGSPEPLDAGTPERRASPVQEEDEYYYEAEEEEEEEEEDEEPMYSREELIEEYQSLMSEREQMANQNFQLQHKLAEYFHKKKSDDQRQDMDKNVTDQEQRYLKYMANLEELRDKDSHQRMDYQQQIDELKDKRQQKQELVTEENKDFQEFKKQVAVASVNSRSGKPIPQKDIEQFLGLEMKKELEVVQVRLENIKLKNRLKKREQQLKAKEELAEGLHLIDFEQLKIENQTYNEKIEERNEELLKLRKKITSTVQVLTHLKEKLQYVQAENQVQKVQLKDVEALVAQKRDILSRTKKARDMLRIDNHRLRQKSGLLGNESLLRDFEERKDEGDELKQNLEALKRRHAELVLNTNGFRKKIEHARAARN
ncbi:cilia- and flagella-associated protein 184-like [Saccoglossus kowalevskii]|uniref:Coiled-coil domain-containing protein 96-like n=1 Tax=Saccoglossus kowalevskii TaxID=10224 RepID=A0ABM0GMN5_SACKO|nr:PREDICTED: coiled-coil domain-containing protein 96-like [Saccoglossus kowalevskii]